MFVELSCICCWWILTYIIILIILLIIINNIQRKNHYPDDWQQCAESEWDKSASAESGPEASQYMDQHAIMNYQCSSMAHYFSTATPFLFFSSAWVTNCQEFIMSQVIASHSSTTFPCTRKRYTQVYSGWPQLDSTLISMIWKACVTSSWRKTEIQN